MKKRIVAIWFPDLITDRMLRRQPELRELPFAFAQSERGSRVIRAASQAAKNNGIFSGMAVADGKAILPELLLFDYEPEQPHKILSALAEWCIRFSPQVAADQPDGLLLDASGCTHLWGGEENYLNDIQQRLNGFSYTIRLAMADTIGAAWAVSRFGMGGTIIPPFKQGEYLSCLPVSALRLETSAKERLEKLGLKTIGSFMNMPRTALLRRFGKGLLKRLGQAMGDEPEVLDPIKPIAPYEERLPCLEPIRTAKGIEIGMKMLLEMLCQRLIRESKGLRKCELLCYRVDGQIKKVETGTSRPSRNPAHIFRLLEQEIPKIAPGLGIELFVLAATVVETLSATQDALWNVSAADEASVGELLDRLAGKMGVKSIHRYLPAEHHWPENSVRESAILTEKPSIEWRTDLPRPLHLLKVPELIEVSAPVPDYPPMLFRYKGIPHYVKKADGPERIEQEWFSFAKGCSEQSSPSIKSYGEHNSAKGYNEHSSPSIKSYGEQSSGSGKTLGIYSKSGSVKKPPDSEDTLQSNQPALYRDYYCIEDEAGARYWLFREGEYGSGNPMWFVHGFFA